jgi:hypothetical protein
VHKPGRLGIVAHDALNAVERHAGQPELYD